MSDPIVDLMRRNARELFYDNKGKLWRRLDNGMTFHGLTHISLCDWVYDYFSSLPAPSYEENVRIMFRGGKPWNGHIKTVNKDGMKFFVDSKRLILLDWEAVDSITSLHEIHGWKRDSITGSIKIWRQGFETVIGGPDEL